MAGNFNELLSLYYNNSFPHQLIYNWLNYKDGGNDCFKFREFSFTLSGDIYIRYLSFDSPFDLRRTLTQKNPLKIDVGAVYNINPAKARTFLGEFKPLQHELVFDIDISDYDDVRNCCKEANICNQCWPFMKIGAKVLHEILTKEFGFKHLLFVYSGRRGFHCWVCDKEARELSFEARRAITDYFSVVIGSQAMVKRVTLPNSHGIHPMIKKALTVIEEDFEDLMIEKQKFLDNDHLIQNVIDLCEDKTLQKQLSGCKSLQHQSKTCWEHMKRLSQSHKPRGKYNYFIQEVMLQHCFPRLDANVTKGLNHLLKLPFCIHPKTGNVCVPFDIRSVDQFDLTKVPNINDLTPEKMDPYVKLMKEFIQRISSGEE